MRQDATVFLVQSDKIARMRSRILLLCLAFAVFGCGLPAIGSPASTSAPSGTTLFRDDFSSPASGWDRNKNAEGVMDYDGGGYRMLVNALQVNLWSTPHKDFSDVRLEVDAGKLGGPDENRIGLICRSNGESYYFFIISNDGYYGLGIFGHGQANLLGQDQMQFNDKIMTGAAVNHLRADCNGDTLTFYVNGFQLAQVHNTVLKHGDVGLLTGTFSQPGVDVVYDNFVVVKP
jgi:hypothetical protein